MRLGIVCASWHADIMHRARDAANDEMERNGVPPVRFDVFEVPRVFEIPLRTKKLVRGRWYDALMPSGWWSMAASPRVRQQAVIDALMRLQLETELPVVSAVLTPGVISTSTRITRASS